MNVEIRDADAPARESLSITQRREALRTHWLGTRARRVCRAVGAEPPACPPSLLAHAVAGVSRQRYPGVELVLTLHRPGFDPNTADRALADCPHPAKVLRVARECPHGAVFGGAAAAASGPLLAKTDDDDPKGPYTSGALCLPVSTP